MIQGLMNDNEQGKGCGPKGELTGSGEGGLKCYIHTDIHTYRPSDEAGSRGACATNKILLI